MNTIPPMQSLPVESPATRAEQFRLPSRAHQADLHPGGFADAAATQRQADRAAAARITFEARLERQRKEQERLVHVATLAREEARAENAAQITVQRRAGFWSGWRWGLACGFPLSGLFFMAVISAGARWKGLA